MTMLTQGFERNTYPQATTKTTPRALLAAVRQFCKGAAIVLAAGTLLAGVIALKAAIYMPHLQ
jgi:hypothetical protein